MGTICILTNYFVISLSAEFLILFRVCVFFLLLLFECVIGFGFISLTEWFYYLYTGFLKSGKIINDLDLNFFP